MSEQKDALEKERKNIEKRIARLVAVIEGGAMHCRSLPNSVSSRNGSVPSTPNWQAAVPSPDLIPPSSRIALLNGGDCYAHRRRREGQCSSGYCADG